MKTSRAMSLIELLIASILLLVTVGGIASFIQRASGIASGERGGIDLQQNRRGAEREITRSLMLAGRGGLPAGRELPKLTPPGDVPYRLPAGIALRLENNTPADRRILSTSASSPRVAAGTDILTVRAVRGEIYRLGKDALSRNADDAVTGRLIVTREGQDLSELEALLSANHPQALLIGSAADIDTYGVAELDAANSTIDGDEIVLAFSFYEPDNPNSQSDRPAKAYAELGPDGLFPLELFRQGAATVGILSELRYYIRHQERDEVAPGEDPTDRLSRAEVYPGLERAYLDDEQNLAVDIAYGIVDLQIALGFDTPLGGTLAAGSGLLTSVDGQNDDWLFNAEGEAADDPNFANLSPWALKEVEVWLLARAPWPDRQHFAPAIDRLGDRRSLELNTDAARRYRRALANWRTQLRNL